MTSTPRARAFSLIEASVVVDLVGIVAAAALSSFSTLARAMRDTRNASSMVVRVHMPLAYLSNELQRSGGNGLPPQAAILVEDDCAARGELPACRGTDRIIVFTAPQAPVCQARALNSSSPRRYAIEWPQGGCCFKTPGFKGHAVLTRKAGGRTLFRPVFLQDQDETCSFTATDVVPDALTRGSADEFNGASVILVEMRTFYLDPEAHHLYLHIDNDAPPAPAAPTIVGKRLLVADQIYDLQAAGGVDVDRDGAVEDDEWVHFAGRPHAFAPRQLWLGTVVGQLDAGRRGGNTVLSLLRGATLQRPGVVVVFVQLRDDSAHRECRAEENLALAALSPLQFTAFIEGELPWRAPVARAIPTVHVNGDDSSTNNVTAGRRTDADDGPALRTGAEPPTTPGQAGSPQGIHWLIDPPRSDDTDVVAAARLANRADLRIIDGVWYVRDDAVRWPGRPIWSDHPGGDLAPSSSAQQVAPSTTNIGQDDVRANLPAGARPTGYSFYESQGGVIVDVDGGVLSYGALANTANGPFPGVWPGSLAGAPTDYCGGQGGFRPVTNCGSERARGPSSTAPAPASTTAATSCRSTSTSPRSPARW